MAFSNTKPHFAVLLSILITCFFLLLNKVKSSDSICFTYSHFGDDVSDITFQGDAKASQGILLLTEVDSNGNPAQNSAGRALFSSPIQLWESSTGRAASFSTSFSFIVQGTSDTPADGFTFFLAPVDTVIPSDGSGGNLALYGTDPTPFVAVEFDTYQNGWDPSVPHIGVDINNVNSVKTANWNITGVEVGSIGFAKINYDAASTELSVYLTYPNVPTSGESTLSYNIALKDHLPQWVKVGLSASTGADVEFNRILSWSFSSNLLNSNSASKNVMSM